MSEPHNSSAPLKPLTEAVAYLLAAAFMFTEVVQKASFNIVTVVTLAILTLAAIIYLISAGGYTAHPSAILSPIKKLVLQYVPLALLFTITATELVLKLRDISFWAVIAFLAALCLALIFGSRSLLKDLTFLLTFTPTLAIEALLTWLSKDKTGLGVILILLVACSLWTAFLYFYDRRKQRTPV